MTDSERRQATSSYHRCSAPASWHLTWASCQFRARCHPCPPERRAGTFAGRIGEFALSLVEGVQVDQRGARAGMAHPVQQLAKTRALVSGPDGEGQAQNARSEPPRMGQRRRVRSQA